MAWRIVRQPDGNLARWSDVVDAFTHHGMSAEQAFRVCRQEGVGVLESRLKVLAGVEDLEPFSRSRGDGTARWRECLETLALVRTSARAIALIRQIGTWPEWEAFMVECGQRHAKA